MNMNNDDDDDQAPPAIPRWYHPTLRILGLSVLVFLTASSWSPLPPVLAVTLAMFVVTLQVYWFWTGWRHDVHADFADAPPLPPFHFVTQLIGTSVITVVLSGTAVLAILLTQDAVDYSAPDYSPVVAVADIVLPMRTPGRHPSSAHPLLYPGGLLDQQGAAGSAWCSTMIAACRLGESTNVLKSTWSTLSEQIKTGALSHGEARVQSLACDFDVWFPKCSREAQAASDINANLSKFYIQDLAPSLVAMTIAQLSLEAIITNTTGNTEQVAAELWWMYNQTLAPTTSQTRSTLKRRLITFWDLAPESSLPYSHRLRDGTYPVYAWLRYFVSPDETAEEIIVKYMHKISLAIRQNKDVISLAENITSQASNNSGLGISYSKSFSMLLGSDTDWRLYPLGQANRAFAGGNSWLLPLQQQIEGQILQRLERAHRFIDEANRQGQTIPPPNSQDRRRVNAMIEGKFRLVDGGLVREIDGGAPL